MLPWTERILDLKCRKITLITSMYPPYPPGVVDLSGGSEIAMERLVNELKDNGIDIDVISLDYIKPNHPDNSIVVRIGEYKPYVLTESALSQIMFFYKELFRPIFFFRILTHLKKRKPEMVIIGKTYQLSLAPMIASRFLRIPYIIRYDWLCPTNPRPELCRFRERFRCAYCIEEISKKRIPTIAKSFSGLYFVSLSLIKKFFWNHAYEVQPVSEFHKAVIASFGIKAEPVCVLPNIIPFESDGEIVSDLMEKYGIKDNFTVLYVGRLEPEKGIEILLEAFNHVTHENRNTKLLIAGSGRLSDKVAAIASRDKAIVYLGRVPHDDLGNYYALSDLVVIPSTVPEGHPVVAEEAMSLGKPIMGFDIGGLKGIFEKYPNSVGVKDMSAESLATAMIEFIAKERSNGA